MPTLIDFRRRIRSVKNTQQITRAMKFVAAAKLRRAQDGVFAARPYARQMQGVLRSAMSRVESLSHPLMARRPEERVLLLVVTGDKGLCGAFNTNVVRRAQEFLREHAKQPVGVVPVGKKGRDALRKRKANLVAEYLNISTRVDFARAKEVAARITAMYTAAETDAVYAIYNEFKSVLSQRLMVEKLLPISPEDLGGEAQGAPAGAAVDYIYEQPPAEIFDKLLPRHVETQVFRVLLESAAAEHAARMTAMDSATNNAAELIDQLTLHMNKVRQAAITKEIIEVVSGAASATS
jgi:F-type H+-transporting ATPase subunit gamma